jgi:hypothetical protein
MMVTVGLHRQETIGLGLGEARAFFGMSSVIALCLSLLVISGFLLWHLKRSGYILANASYLIELIYWLGARRFYLGIHPYGPPFPAIGGEVSSVAGVEGIANLGLFPQLFVVYPILCLLLLNFAGICIARRSSNAINAL